MDPKVAWTKLCDVAKESPHSFDSAYDSFISELLEMPEAKSMFGDQEAPRAEFHSNLRTLLDGVFLELGTRPQAAIAFFASLYFIAQGKRAFVFSGLQVDIGPYQGLIQFFAGAFGIQPNISGGASDSKGKDRYQGDLILCDYMQFVQDVVRSPELLDQQPAAAIFCEADVCLYDNRVFYFKDNRFRATGAVYRTSKKAKSLTEGSDVVDFRDTAKRFDAICAMVSYITPAVAREMELNYCHVFNKFHWLRSRSTVVPYLYPTEEVKVQAICDDIEKGSCDALIFHFQKNTRTALWREMRKRKKTVISLNNTRDIIAFLGTEKKTPHVGFFNGMPGLFTAHPEYVKPKVTVIVAEHFPFAHHHEKVRVFADEAVDQTHAEASLYFSLEDEIAAFYANNQDFSGSFRLVNLAEKKFPGRLTRKLVAESVLKKVYNLRNAYLTEDIPLFTTIPPPPGKAKQGKLQRGVGKQLKGLCFCGSGKPFRECHGKRK